MHRILSSILFLFLLTSFVQCGVNFRLGRSKHGNLGAPVGADKDSLPPNKYFLQKLDHSSPTDQRYWEQVNINKNKF